MRMFLHDDPPRRVPGIPGAWFRQGHARGRRTAPPSAPPVSSPVVLRDAASPRPVRVTVSFQRNYVTGHQITRNIQVKLAGACYVACYAPLRAA